MTWKEISELSGMKFVLVWNWWCKERWRWTVLLQSMARKSFADLHTGNSWRIHTNRRWRIAWILGLHHSSLGNNIDSKGMRIRNLKLEKSCCVALTLFTTTNTIPTTLVMHPACRTKSAVSTKMHTSTRVIWFICRRACESPSRFLLEIHSAQHKGHSRVWEALSQVFVDV